MVLRVFNILPVNSKKIFFCSYEGRQYSCNPKYIFKYLLEKYGNDYSYVWCLNDTNLFDENTDNIIFVSFLSFKYIFNILTSKIVITNLGPEPFFPFKKHQIIINTWHGGGSYKKQSIALQKNKTKRFYAEKIRDLRASITTYIISSCKNFTFFRSQDWKFPAERFLPIGMPRNDLFFRDTGLQKEKIKKYCNLGYEVKVILYAPTFRGNHRAPDQLSFSIDFSGLKNILSNVFGGQFVVMYRGHSNLVNNMITYPDTIQMTNYPDMQELLCAADILITDFSSSMWDFSFTNKPCFIYAPDLDKYDSERGFHIAFSELPFSIAKTNEELIDNIKNFNHDEYMNKLKQHHLSLGSFETGKASEQLTQIILR
jgi:CDP-glycerol glycerophosphotransferase